VSSDRRSLPAVEKLMQQISASLLPRPAVVALVRQELARLRAVASIPTTDEIVSMIESRVTGLERERLQPVINGTGVILHTNFGRAPLGAAAVQAVSVIAGNYNTLEFDLARGGRGSRAAYLERLLALLVQAEAATVVNNCAAALVLLVRHFTAKKPEVVISRGELVQIGGEFRIGDIIAASGGRLREVGATNKTVLSDYERAVGPDTGLILRVHQSNFYFGGFAGAPPNDEIGRLARRRRVPFVVDLGSGALTATEKLGVTEHEPTPAETLRCGADLVCFSGDKLFGGPQAGIIAGKARLVAALKRAPLFRALRCDKMVFAALEATTEGHLRGAVEEIPALALLRVPLANLRARAVALVRLKKRPSLQIKIVESVAEIGGGALPRSRIPSIALEISSAEFSPNELADQLRRARVPIVGYIARGSFRLDLRTVFPTQDEQIADAL
jgi:L-seryl-tRNA(Ser) seleniumtransferase